MNDYSPIRLQLDPDAGPGGRLRPPPGPGGADDARAAAAARTDVEAALGRLMGLPADGVTVLPGAPDAALEAALLTLIQPGDVVVAAVNGALSGQMADRAARAGADVIAVEHEAGEAVDLARVEAALWAQGARLCLAAHADSATGVMDDPGPLCALAREHGALPLIECSASLGVAVVDGRAWGAQVVCAGAGAGLDAPTGVAILALGAQAQAVMAARQAPPVTWTLDLARRPGAGALPPALLFALRQALVEVERPGAAARRDACGRLRDGLAAGLAALGLTAGSPAARSAPGLVIVLAPVGVNVDKARRRMQDAFGVEVGLFEGASGARGWRAGLLGAWLAPADVRLALAAFCDALDDQGVRSDLAAALGAADLVLSGH